MNENEVPTPEITEEIESYVTSVIAAYARSYSLVDGQDLRQHLYLTWLEKPDKVLTAFAKDENPEEGPSAVMRLLSGWAADYCRGETAAIRGYCPEDVFHYTRKQIRALLPMLAYPTAWTSLAVRASDEGRQCGAPLAERADELAVLADLNAGLAKLSDKDRNILFIRFIETGVGDALTEDEEATVHVAYEDICDLYDIGPETVRKAVTRSVTRLLKKMGGPRTLNVHPGRHALSNAAAQVRTRTAWDGN